MKNSQQLKFTKMHGLGNDFMVVDAIRQNVTFTPELIRQLADRHRGIGFDQLLLAETSHDAEVDFFYRIFNADGSEVAQCGNGARCLARFLYEQGLLTKDSCKVATKTSVLELFLNGDQVTVNMGIPSFIPSVIPLLTEHVGPRHILQLEQQMIEFNALSLGNPHAVICVNDVAIAPVQELGGQLAKHTFFPESVNVGFMQILAPDLIKLRVYERGAGETQACGSGACAAVVAGCLEKKLADKVTVILPGGELQISWNGEGQPVFMTGPAVTVFEGIIYLA